MRYGWERLADGVYRCRLPFLDVSVGLVVGSRGLLLIDSGTTVAEAEAVSGDVRELTGRAVTHLVLTHHHFDHILGSAGFPDAAIYAAPPVGLALSSGLEALCREASGHDADPGEVSRAARGVRPPDHLVWCARIDLGDRVVAIEHPGRGHTDHDLVVVIDPVTPEERVVVFCGDLVEESADPAIGDDSDLGAWPAALDRVLELGGDGAVYLPGHGAAVDADFVAAQRDWLRSRC